MEREKGTELDPYQFKLRLLSLITLTGNTCKLRNDLWRGASVRSACPGQLTPRSYISGSACSCLTAHLITESRTTSRVEISVVIGGRSSFIARS